MADHLEEMPLFPLHAVLFPYARIQLHISDDRYRLMMKECEEFDRPFGVVLIRPGHETSENPEPYLVGTTARIEKLHRYPDGRLHVSARGERRFRIRRFGDHKPYQVGFTEPVGELEAAEPNRLYALASRAEETFKLLIEGFIARPDMNVEVQFPEDPSALSFMIANFLNIENVEKQKLLECTDPTERLSDLVPLIERQIIESKSQRLQKLTSEHMQEWITPN